MNEKERRRDRRTEKEGIEGRNKKKGKKSKVEEIDCERGNRRGKRRP